MRPAETFGAEAKVVEKNHHADGRADGDDADDERSAGVLVGVEAARGDVEDALGKDGNDKRAEECRDEHITAVHDEVNDVTTGEEGDDGNR